ncbi:MAG: efflux RND transporter periplasmic adaptor subunit [Gammaproteobacteria bacterium]|nr:MAG: efflux RND transporter periplasmic adaptor subunit [Gammaproteobacteria bacterium]
MIGALLTLALSGCDNAAETNKKSRSSGKDHLVEVVTAVQETAQYASQHTGILRARRIFRVYNQEAGRIKTLKWFEGDEVLKDDLLVSLDDELLRAQLGKAKAEVRRSQLALKRQRNLAKGKLASEEDLIQAETEVAVAKAEEQLLRIRLGYMRIHAPFSGVITERLAEPGDVKSENTHLMTLIDPQSLIVETRVSELILPMLKIGDQAEVRIDALGNKTYAGTIKRIHPGLEKGRRQGIVEISLSEIPEQARAGQLSKVTLKPKALERLMLPFATVRRDNQGEYVFRISDDLRAERIAIKSGVRLGDRIEILNGLKAGDQIVRRGFLNLRSGDQVRLTNPKTAQTK